MRGMIYAVSPEGIIGVGNRIPWRYQGDFRRRMQLVNCSASERKREAFKHKDKPVSAGPLFEALP